MLSPEKSETRSASGFNTLSYNAYIDGLNRRLPLGGSGIKDAQALKDYKKGFKAGVLRDFEAPITGLEIPEDGQTYDAFISGVAAVTYPYIGTALRSSRYEKPKVRRAYELGLKLLMLHLGYPLSSIEDRITYAINHPEIVDMYRQEAERIGKEEAV